MAAEREPQEKLLPDLTATYTGRRMHGPQDVLTPREQRRLDRDIIKYEERRREIEGSQVVKRLGW